MNSECHLENVKMYIAETKVHFVLPFVDKMTICLINFQITWAEHVV